MCQQNTAVTIDVCVCSDGTLCLDIIQDMWSPCQSVSSILTSVQSLLQVNDADQLTSASPCTTTE